MQENSSGWSGLAVVTALAGAAAIIAAFLPWADARVEVLIIDTTVTVDGTDTDGKLTLFLGACVVVAVLAGVYAGLSQRAASLAAAGFGLGIVTVGVLSVLDLNGVIDADSSNLEDLPFVDVEAKVGLWLTIAAGAVATLAGLAAAVPRLSGRRTPSA